MIFPSHLTLKKELHNMHKFVLVVTLDEMELVGSLTGGGVFFCACVCVCVSVFPDSAVFVFVWFRTGRMLEGGEDAKYIARRLVR